MNLIIPVIFGLPIDNTYMIAVFAVLLGFFLVNWDEYHTHTLYLTAISGPVEGTITFTASAFIAGFFGPTIWDSLLHNIFGINASSKPIALAILILGGLVTAFSSLVRVLKKNPLAIFQLSPFLVSSIFAGCCFYFEPICKEKAAEFLLFIGFSFANAMVSNESLVYALLI